MKVLFVTNRNPYFKTITEYTETALARECAVQFFDDRQYWIPGRLRKLFPALERFDLNRINQTLTDFARKEKPDLVLVAGGLRLLPQTIRMINASGIKTALWTIDPPRYPVRLQTIARDYAYVFTGGSEAHDLLKDIKADRLFFLPFACDPHEHYPETVSAEEQKRYGCDLAFVGTVDPRLYAHRVSVLEQVSDFDLGIWGPGSSGLSVNSPLRRLIRGQETSLEAWRKIYAAAKIALCIHYKDPAEKIACHQASPRVFEALACGKLLMVDDQRDVRALFKDREDLVIFKDANQLRELASYYLQHPEEGMRIAKHGRETVLKEHTYLHRVRTILTTVFG